MLRNPRIDQLRGILIALVVLGHIVLGSVHDNLIRYSIYAFHMPVFIALSGFLINAETLKNSSFADILVRYWHRALKPFSIAFLFFTGVLAIHAVQGGRLDNAWLLNAFTTPYYHLWFVPTLVLWVIGLAITLKLRIPLFLAFCLSLVASLLWASLAPIHLNGLIAALTSKKLVYFLSFFLLGVLFRQYLSGMKKRFSKPISVLVLAIIGLLGFYFYLSLVGPEKSFTKAFAWYSLNLSLIVLSVLWMKRSNLGEHAADGSKISVMNTFESMGRLSLPIYLWHVLPLFVLKGLDVHESQPLFYYVWGVLGCLLVVWGVLHLERRSQFIDRWVYGLA